MEYKEGRTVSAFEHENALMHYGRVNKRSMITTICVCVMAILMTAIFVTAYTVREKDRSEREKFLIEKILELRDSNSTEVAADGVHQQPNP